jgi:hypothetical protein
LEERESKGEERTLSFCRFFFFFVPARSSLARARALVKTHMQKQNLKGANPGMASVLASPASHERGTTTAHSKGDRISLLVARISGTELSWDARALSLSLFYTANWMVCADALHMHGNPYP